VKRRRSSTWLDDNFRLLENAASVGERCPQTYPHGPIGANAITKLVAAGRIRSEVYRYNYRVVTILVGPHKGKSTAPAAPGLAPYLINGVHVDRRRNQRSSHDHLR
jgi:hypothetical protein